MKSYVLRGETPLRFDGGRYREGDPVEAEEAAVAHLVASGRLIESEATLIGSSVLPAEMAIGEGLTIQLGDLVAYAQGAAGMSVAEWNARAEDAIEASLAEALELLKAVLRAGKAVLRAGQDKGGKPNVKDVEKILGRDISAEIRDRAWAAIEGWSTSPA